MKLTRQHFELVANTIAGLPEEYRLEVAKKFASSLAETNSNFNREKFLAWCMGERVGRASNPRPRAPRVKRVTASLPTWQPPKMNTGFSDWWLQALLNGQVSERESEQEEEAISKMKEQGE